MNMGLLRLSVFVFEDIYRYDIYCCSWLLWSLRYLGVDVLKERYSRIDNILGLQLGVEAASVGGI